MWRNTTSKASTLWSIPSRYTRVLRAANGRFFLNAPFDVQVVFCTWTVAHVLILFRLFGVDPSLFCTFQHSTSEREFFRYWQTRRSWRAFDNRNSLKLSPLHTFSHQLGLAFYQINCCSADLWYDGYVLSVPKPTLKRVLHVQRRTFLGQYLSFILLRSLVAFLGQGCLSGSGLSVSHNPCTASWCQPDRLLYGLPKDRRLFVVWFVRLCCLISWDTPIQLDADFLTYLRWFQRQNVMTGVPLHLPEPSLFFFTDASLKGWGSSWKNLDPESLRHINWLELEAIRLALLHWGPQWRSQSVRVYCDNSTAVAYIRKQGGTHSCFTKHWNCSISWISLW